MSSYFLIILSLLKSCHTLEGSDLQPGNGLKSIITLAVDCGSCCLRNEMAFPAVILCCVHVQLFYRFLFSFKCMIFRCSRCFIVLQSLLTLQKQISSVPAAHCNEDLCKIFIYGNVCIWTLVLYPLCTMGKRID